MREENLSCFDEPEFKRALEKYENALATHSSVYLDADELTDIAEYYMTQGMEDEANEAIQLALDLHPESVDPQIFLARQQMFYGNMEEAHKICDAIMDQNDREVHFLKAELMIREQKSPDASLYLMGVYEKLDEDQAEFLYDATGIFMDYDQWKIAEKWCKKLNREFPNHKSGSALYPEILVGLGEYEKAIPLLNQMLDENPYNVSAWYMLAESNANLENFREAVDACEYVLAINSDDNRALILKANCLFQLNQASEAQLIYQKFLESHPDDPTIHYLNAVCLSNLERYNEAATELRKANEVGDEMAPEQMQIYLEQSFVEGKLHHLENALKALDKAKSLMTDDVSFDYDMLAGQLYLENGRQQSALDHFCLAIGQSKHQDSTLLAIAISYQDAQMYQNSLDILLDMEKLYGEDVYPKIYPYIAWCYWRTNEKSIFLKYLKKAIELNPELTQYLFEKDFPGIMPDEYYMYAFRRVWGRFPTEED